MATCVSPLEPGSSAGNWTRRDVPPPAEWVVPWLVLSIVCPPRVSSDECSCVESRAGLSARRDPGRELESSWTKMGGSADDDDGCAPGAGTP